MSRFGAKTYSRREVKSSLQFDQLLSDNKNKPSTAKVSVSSVQRWGMASFTSIRKTQLNKQPAATDNKSSVKRKRMDTKSEPPDRSVGVFCDDPFSFDPDSRIPASSVGQVPVPVVPVSQNKPNKFFKSREVKPLAAQNSPKIEPPPPARDITYKSSSDMKFKQLAMETFPSTKKTDFSKSGQLVQENVGAHFIQQKPTENIDLLCLQNPDPMEERSPTHSENSPLSDYFGLPESCERTEEAFLPKASEKLYSTPDYSGEFDNLLLSQKNSAPPKETGNSVVSSNPVRSGSVPQTRTYTRSQKRAEGLVVSQTTPSSSQLPEGLPTQYNALPPIGSLTRESPGSSETLLSVTESSGPQPPLCLVPKTWSESIGVDSQGTDSGSLQLSQESKGTLSVPSLTDSQQSNSENEFGGHKHRLRSHYSGLKSRRIFNSPKLKKATYKHRPWQAEDAEETEETEQSSLESGKIPFGDDIEVDEMGRAVVFDGHKLTLSKQIKPSKRTGEAITSWTCQRKVKELYTVVHNVKQAYQCHESGETQEFNDDVEYLLEGIQQTSSLGTRCLSTLGWASKCMVPSFRIHIRAHGTMSSVYSALADAPKEPSLSLCVATLMFVLSQDRLTMDLEAGSLSLMLQLLDTSESPGDSSMTAASSQNSQVGGDSQVSLCSSGPASSLNDTISVQQNNKVMEKVRHLCEVMKQNGYAKQLDLNDITTGNLAMETLLSMTSRKAGEWFKEEIRTLGGLDYIIDAVHMCVDLCSDSSLVMVHPVEEELNLLRKVDRCLRVLENVSYSNTDNQNYLLEYKGSSLLQSCVSLLHVCVRSISHCPLGGLLEQSTVPVRRREGPAAVFFACILSLLKVLINLTNENRHGSQLAGSQEGLVQCILLCILQTPQSVPQDERFDLLVLSLGLLINLMEGCEDNRHQFVLLKTFGSFDCQNNGYELSSVEALVEVFLNRCDLARQCEEHTDALLDGQQSGQRSPGRDQNGSGSISGGPSSSNQSSHQSRAEEMEETLMKALQKAGKNMEHTMIAAYIALLLGFIIETSEYADLVKAHLPEEDFRCMVDVLRKFLNFINLTGSISTTGVKTIQRVLGTLEAS